MNGLSRDSVFHSGLMTEALASNRLKDQEASELMVKREVFKS